MAAARGANISTFGVVKIKKDDSGHTCYFDNFETLSGTFSSLLDSGALPVLYTARRVD
jgi:hypothetical protein